MKTMLPPQSEANFQRQVIQLAKLYRWRVAHFRPARTEHGWRTPVEADGNGFPDLVLIRGLRLVIIELKSDRGKLSREQQDWLDAFDAVPGVEVVEARPADWHYLEQLLA